MNLQSVIPQKIIQEAKNLGACNFALNWLKANPKATFQDLRDFDRISFVWGVRNVPLPSAFLSELAKDQSVDVREVVTRNNT